ncbi:MAG: phosphate regulon sensor histidine kinase PhoR [Gammaproteobacteria bacterium]
MSRHLWLEYLCVAVLVAAALIVGWLTGHMGITLFIAALLYLGWNLLNLYRLNRWLTRNRRFDVPHVWGFWGGIFEQFYRLRRRDRDRKRRVAQLLREIRDTSAAMPDGLVILDRNGEIRWLNAAAGRLLQLRVLQDIGQRLRNLVRHPDFIHYLTRGDFREPVTLEAPFTRGQHLSLQIVPYGEEQRLVLVRDVTHLRRLEDMRREFVANASHELRSPLAVISGYLESMCDDVRLREDWAEPLAAMQNQAARMTAIVADLLELSRLETERREAPYAPVNVAALAERIREAALALHEGPADVALEVDGGLQLLGAEREIYSAFSNLVFNAMKYTPADGRVSVSWRRDAQGAVFSVTDTGIGISAAHLPRLTERFYRVDRSRQRESGGTGLGLAIVKHVLQHHGATLSIDSTPGRGSRFSCHFGSERLSPADRGTPSG